MQAVVRRMKEGLAHCANPDRLWRRSLLHQLKGYIEASSFELLYNISHHGAVCRRIGRVKQHAQTWVSKQVTRRHSRSPKAEAIPNLAPKTEQITNTAAKPKWTISSAPVSSLASVSLRSRIALT